MEETWESGLGPVTVHVLLNELGTIGSVARTLRERWMLLDEEQQFHSYHPFDLASRMLLDGADESAESELDDLLLLGALQQLQEEEQQHQQAGVDEGSAAEM